MFCFFVKRTITANKMCLKMGYSPEVIQNKAKIHSVPSLFCWVRKRSKKHWVCSVSVRILKDSFVSGSKFGGSFEFGGLVFFGFVIKPRVSLTVCTG